MKNKSLMNMYCIPAFLNGKRFPWNTTLWNE